MILYIKHVELDSVINVLGIDVIKQCIIFCA